MGIKIKVDSNDNPYLILNSVEWATPIENEMLATFISRARKKGINIDAIGKDDNFATIEIKGEKNES